MGGGGVKGCLPPQTLNHLIITPSKYQNTEDYPPQTFKIPHFIPLNILSLDIPLSFHDFLTYLKTKICLVYTGKINYTQLDNIDKLYNGMAKLKDERVYIR